MVNSTTKLSTGAILSVNDERVRIDLPTSPTKSYQSISSAILNGGCHTFPSTSSSSSSSPSTANSSSSTTTPNSYHIINYKVPSTYNGYNPQPLQLLSNFAIKERIQPPNTVGLLTAASMQSVGIASRSAFGVTSVGKSSLDSGGESNKEESSEEVVNIDVIVTAGLSNSRSSGADADYFILLDDNNDNPTANEQEAKSTASSPTPPGTINTIIIIDKPLTSSALIEAYAIAIEAKCLACIEHTVLCSKDNRRYGMGTGTDCCVLVCPTPSSSSVDDKEGSSSSVDGKQESNKKVIKHAGKHTLFAELLGQAVHEATSKSIMINIHHLHYNYFTYIMKQWLKSLVALLRGARPCIPSQPMMPIPTAPYSVVLMGVLLVLLTYTVPVLNDKTKLLLGAVIWDRYLGEPPLKFHPVCLAGSAISMVLKYTPERVYKNGMLGFTAGFMLLAGMLLIFVYGAWLFLQVTDAISTQGTDLIMNICPNGYCNNYTHIQGILNLTSWILQLLLFKSTFSIQLLTTIALQMAKLLERNQINSARLQLSWLCSRDPTNLNASELAGGTLESLSENLSDGFVAPLFWYVCLGPVGALGYRIINTLDSRIGYRGRYEWFGKSSARLDDLINLIPARITAVLLVVAALFVKGCSAQQGIYAAWKDRNQCSSPNAGWPMAAFAGILGVKLSKKGEYCLNSSGVEPGPSNIRAGHRVASIAGGLTVLVAVITLVVMK